MRIKTKVLLIMVIFAASCAENSFEYEDCEVSINDVIFSKSVNNGADRIKILGKNKVEINSGPESDFFNAANGRDKYVTAPLLLTPIDNESPFTFVAKLTPQFSGTYDAGALYMFSNADKWLKLAFERDESGLTRMVTVRTNGTSDDNNHDAIEGQSVFLKISSDTESIGYYYSKDNVDWQLVRVYKNDFPSNTYIGISSQSPLGDGIKTTFENISLTKAAIKDFRKGI